MPKKIKKLKQKPKQINNKNKLNNKIHIHIDNSKKLFTKPSNKTNNPTKAIQNHPHIVYLNSVEIPKNVFTDTIEPKKVEIPKEVEVMSPLVKRVHSIEPTIGKRRGRPLGSKNKPPVFAEPIQSIPPYRLRSSEKGYTSE